MTATDTGPLVVSKTIAASRERVFAAWVEPAHMMRWWGPTHVTCIEASVDLKVGGAYRIANQLPDDTVIWISGEYEVVEVPSRLVYLWTVEGRTAEPERVTVEFTAAGDGSKTEVVVTHERIADEPTREDHKNGWIGCLDGLAEYLTDRDAP